MSTDTPSRFQRFREFLRAYEVPIMSISGILAAVCIIAVIVLSILFPTYPFCPPRFLHPSEQTTQSPANADAAPVCSTGTCYAPPAPNTDAPADADAIPPPIPTPPTPNGNGDAK